MTHYSSPLVFFVPLSVQCWTPVGLHQVLDEDSVGWKHSGISGSLYLAAQCCVPEAVFWAEEEYGLSVCTSHHHLVQFGVPQAVDHTLRRAGENSITQEVTTLTDTTDGNRVKHLEWMVIWALACYSSCVIWWCSKRLREKFNMFHVLSIGMV